MTKNIGPSFTDELVAAGLAGLPFTWSADGDLHFDPSMTDQQIASVQSVLAAHDPEKPSWAAHQQQALVALEESDKTVLRCAENGVALPPEWAAYRKALRAIVGSETGDASQESPVRPAYPAGT